MSQRRISYDPDDGSQHSEALGELDQYARATNADDRLTAAAAADRARTATRRLSDEALLQANETHSARQLAAELGLAHGTVNHRLRQARRTNSDHE